MSDGSSVLMNDHNLTGSSFGFSAADVDYLAENGSSEYTLVTLLVDESPSVDGFKTEMEECIKRAIGACKMSPRSDFLMVRVVVFNSDLREIHGFKQLVDINLDDYTGCLHTRGGTMFYDAGINVIEATCSYGQDLANNDIAVNAIVILITDGMDNRSSGTASDMGDSLKKIRQEESLESILSILVGVGVDEKDPDDPVNQYLQDCKNEAGITQYVALKDADEATLAKLADFISRSVSAQSNSLKSGAASIPLTI